MTAFDLQVNLAHRSLQFYKLDKARDPRFASVRAGRDIRRIVHKTQASLLPCCVGHHDAAYDWAERRKLETHSTNGAAQLVEIRETIEEIKVPKYTDVEQPTAPQPPLFARTSDETLLGYGVPAEWFADARTTTEDALFALVNHLPSEAAKALLEPATLRSAEATVTCIPIDGKRGAWYTAVVIASFKDREAEALFTMRRASKRLAPYADVALRKLVQIHAAGRIDDLAVPPGNNLKKLGGSSVWQIRIERQHRVRFRWDGRDAYEVEIGDFH